MVSIEVCIDSFESARNIAHIVNQGSNRIELCGNLIYGGGITPSVGVLRHIKTVIDPSRIMAMIRPRTGSFVYTHTEVQTMIQDIKAFKDEGVRGVVIGCLTPDGYIDVDATEKLVAAAQPCEVTFHRAFDITSGSWKENMAKLQNIKGITRLLTSGHGKTALEGSTELQGLIEQSKVSGIVICPASGINDRTVQSLKDAVPDLEEVHLSGSRAVDPPESATIRSGERMGFGRQEWHLDRERVERVWDIVKDW